jgi:hypothetical protein
MKFTMLSRQKNYVEIMKRNLLTIAFVSLCVMFAGAQNWVVDMHNPYVNFFTVQQGGPPTGSKYKAKLPGVRAGRGSFGNYTSAGSMICCRVWWQAMAYA